MKLNPQIVHTLERFMDPSHPNPFKLHELAIPVILQSFGGEVGGWFGNPVRRRPVVVHAPTGHGKTAAFTLPILQVL